MPNKKGGKNYKKSKHTDDEPVLYEKQEGQMYARVIKLLGGCNALVYCNDGRERLCHIRGSMRRKVWISTGDLVLISLRQYETDCNRGDICSKYDSRVIHRLQQRDSTINPKLFTLIEKSDTGGGSVPVEDDDGFVFDGGRCNDESDESDNSDEDTSGNRATQKKQMMLDMDDDADINIDDI